MGYPLSAHPRRRARAAAAGARLLAHRAAGVADSFDARRLAGLVLGFTGVAALVGLDLGGSDPVAVAEMGVVALCYASGPLIIIRKLDDLQAIGVVTASLVVTAVLYAPAGMATMPASLSAATIGAVVVLAVVCTVAAFLAFFALIREVGPSRSTVVTYVNPLVAVLLGIAILSEPFTLGIAVGMPLILVGSVLGTAPSLRPADGVGAKREESSEEPPTGALAAGPPAP